MSRILKLLEEQYSVNKLEPLVVVWAKEYFKYYLYGKKLTVITDHQTLTKALNSSGRSKASETRLTNGLTG